MASQNTQPIEAAQQPEQLPRASDSPVPVAWVRADLRGAQRTLAWYVDRAESGDQQAAMRALLLCARSLSPAALQQNGMTIDHVLADALRRILGSEETLGDSRILRVARGKTGGRKPIERDAAARWLLCVDMHRILLAEPEKGQDDAAAEVLAQDGVSYSIDPASLARTYRDLREDLVEEFNENEEISKQAREEQGAAHKAEK